MTNIEILNEFISPYDVARRYLGKPKRSDKYCGWWCSPITNEKTASLQVFREHGRGFRDFSGNANGDSVMLYCEIKNTTVATAIKELANDFGITLNKRPTKEQRLAIKKRKEQEEQAKELLHDIHYFFSFMKKYFYEKDLIWDNATYMKLCKLEYVSREYKNIKTTMKLFNICNNKYFYSIIIARDNVYNNYISNKLNEVIKEKGYE